MSDAKKAQLWTAAAFGSALRKRTKPTQLCLNRKAVIAIPFGGGIECFEDRCPHQGLPLSKGSFCADQLECAYHGWRFGSAGHVEAVPGLTKGHPHPRVTLKKIPHLWQDDVLFLRQSSGDTLAQDMSASDMGKGLPSIPRLAGASEKGIHTHHIRWSVKAQTKQIIENILDVPHTLFVHRGLFRKSTHTEITAQVNVHEAGFETRYAGESRPDGVLARILGAPSSGDLTHIDRYIAPNIVQVDYRLGHLAILATFVMVEKNEGESEIHLRLESRLPLRARLLTPILVPLFKIIQKQDQSILEAQHRSLRAHRDFTYAHTQNDWIPSLVQSFLSGHQATPHTFQRTLVL